MIYDAIERLGDELEHIALLLHKPQTAVYVVVKEDGTYRVMDCEKFNFNSKFSLWDFYSVLGTVNQAVDKTKTIQSNNKYSFFVRNLKKLTKEIIENYYISTELQEDEFWIKEWIFSNIKKFYDYNGSLVKIFFYTSAEKYREAGRKYILERCLKNIQTYGDIEFGSGVGVTENAKKPFLMNRTRKVPELERINRNFGYKKYIFFEMLKSCVRWGKNIIYITDEGKVILTDKNKGPEEFIMGGIVLVVKMDSKGQVVIDWMEPVIDFNPFL